MRICSYWITDNLKSALMINLALETGRSNEKKLGCSLEELEQRIRERRMYIRAGSYVLNDNLKY